MIYSCQVYMIITGAPLDQLNFEDVFYWEEVCSILDWSKTNVKSVFHSCWGALAGLYHDFGVKTACLPEKLSVYLKSADNKLFYSTAHPEYGRGRLMYEYNRDKDMEYVYNVNFPKHYFPDDNPDETPLSYWIEDADKLFEN